MLSELLRIYPDNKFLNSITKDLILPMKKQENKVDIWSMPFKELEAYYYKGLINLCDGIKKKAAKKAGIPTQTFYSRLRSLKKEGYIKSQY
jgi:DNA-binding NtrC family response regulator